MTACADQFIQDSLKIEKNLYDRNDSLPFDYEPNGPPFKIGS